MSKKRDDLGGGGENKQNDFPITEAYLYSHNLNHIIGFWARLCPSLLTFHRSPVKPRAFSEPLTILLVIYIAA